VYVDNLNVSSVPVPAAIWLFASGLIGMLGFYRVKAKHKIPFDKA